MPVSDVLQEDVQREIRRLRAADEDAFTPLLDSWPGPTYDPQDPRTYPDE